MLTTKQEERQGPKTPEANLFSDRVTVERSATPHEDAINNRVVAPGSDRFGVVESNNRDAPDHMSTGTSGVRSGRASNHRMGDRKSKRDTLALTGASTNPGASGVRSGRASNRRMGDRKSKRDTLALTGASTSAGASGVRSARASNHRMGDRKSKRDTLALTGASTSAGGSGIRSARASNHRMGDRKSKSETLSMAGSSTSSSSGASGIQSGRASSHRMGDRKSKSDTLDLAGFSAVQSRRASIPRILGDRKSKREVEPAQGGTAAVGVQFLRGPARNMGTNRLGARQSLGVLVRRMGGIKPKRYSEVLPVPPAVPTDQANPNQRPIEEVIIQEIDVDELQNLRHPSQEGFTHESTGESCVVIQGLENPIQEDIAQEIDVDIVTEDIDIGINQEIDVDEFQNQQDNRRVDPPPPSSHQNSGSPDIEQPDEDYTGQELAVAMPVQDDEEFRDLPQAEDVDAAAQKMRRKAHQQKNLEILAIGVLLIMVVLIGL